MSLEVWNTVATLGTFLVIAATAITAVIQLRHARSSNQIEALSEIRQTIESDEFRSALDFVFSADFSARLEDRAFRYQIANRHARTVENQLAMTKVNRVANFFESVGLLMKAGFADRELVLQTWGLFANDVWDRLSGVAAIFRRHGDSRLWENFEYLAILSEDWTAAHPHGSYPPGMRRKVLNDPWRATDEAYEASLHSGS